MMGDDGNVLLDDAIDAMESFVTYYEYSIYVSADTDSETTVGTTSAGTSAGSGTTQEGPIGNARRIAMLRRQFVLVAGNHNHNSNKKKRTLVRKSLDDSDNNHNHNEKENENENVSIDDDNENMNRNRQDTTNLGYQLVQMLNRVVDMFVPVVTNTIRRDTMRDIETTARIKKNMNDTIIIDKDKDYYSPTIAVAVAESSTDTATDVTTGITTTGAGMSSSISKELTSSSSSSLLIIVQGLLRRVLHLIEYVCSVDPILSEEMVYQALHSPLLKLIKIYNDNVHVNCNNKNNSPSGDGDVNIEDDDDGNNDDDDDDYYGLEIIHEIALQVAESSTRNNNAPKFPYLLSSSVSASASVSSSSLSGYYTNDELISRLPLSFTFRTIDTDTNCTIATATATAITTDNSCDSNGSCRSNPTTGSNICIDNILLQQVTKRQSAQDDVGFVVWPSAVTLSKWILQNQDLFCRLPPPQQQQSSCRRLRVLELGSGCGLCGLVVAALFKKQQQQQQAVLLQDRFQKEDMELQKQTQMHRSNYSPQVLLSDFNPTVLSNLRHNIELNDVSDICSTVGLDFYYSNQTQHNNAPTSSTGSNGWIDMDGNVQDYVDIVIGADIICQPSDSVAIVQTLDRIMCPPKNNSSNVGTCSTNGSHCVAYIVCANSKHRFGVDVFPDAILNNSGTNERNLKLTSMHPIVVRSRDSSRHQEEEEEKSLLSSEDNVEAPNSTNSSNSDGSNHNNNNNDSTTTTKSATIIVIDNDNIHEMMEHTSGYVNGMELTLYVIERM